jgi:diguanylate cyclase (GGDEF)-like protein
MEEQLRYKNLFLKIINNLGENEDLYAPIPDILEEMYEFFRFGCGFVYQGDYAGVFSLNESYLLYKNENLSEQLQLETSFSKEEIARLAEQRAVIAAPAFAKNDVAEKLSALLGAQILVLVPIVDDEKTLIGFIGMSDRRGNIGLSTEDYEVAISILTVAANQIKLRLYQEQIYNSRRALERRLDNMGIDVYVNDFYTHEILYVNKSMAAPYGGVEALRGQKCWKALYEDKQGQCEYCPQKKLLDESGNPTRVYSWDYERPFDGAWFRVFSAAFPWVDGRLAHVVSSVDITENKQNEKLIRHMAEYDELTGLPNRGKLVADMENALAALQGTEKKAYVLFFDLNDFKQVNDTLGHRAGDEVLERIGKILEASPLTKAHGYRHSGDEFVLFYTDITEVTLREVVAAIEKRAAEPHYLQDGVAHVPVSIGIAVYPAAGTDPETLIHNADMAMYAAKQDGVYDAFVYDENGNIPFSLWHVEE